MSMDFFSECKSCGKNLSVSLWIQVHGSISSARVYGRGPADALSAVVMIPGLIKVDLCYGCKVFRPTSDFTPEEISAMKEHKEEGEKLEKLASDMQKLFGIFKREDQK